MTNKPSRRRLLSRTGAALAVATTGCLHLPSYSDPPSGIIVINRHDEAHTIHVRFTESEKDPEKVDYSNAQRETYTVDAGKQQTDPDVFTKPTRYAYRVTMKGSTTTEYGSAEFHQCDGQVCGGTLVIFVGESGMLGAGMGYD